MKDISQRGVEGKFAVNYNSLSRLTLEFSRSPHSSPRFGFCISYEMLPQASFFLTHVNVKTLANLVSLIDFSITHCSKI